MFEAMTYDAILADLLSRVTSDIDKREGSIIYDALAPCAYQLAQAYFNLDNFIDLVSGDTAVEEYLDRVVADYGLTRKAATYAVRQIETTAAVNIGTRWGISDTTYKITELLSENVYSATCEQTGDIGNTYSGKLENIDNVSGVTAALTSIITAGEEEETDDALRERFYNLVQAVSTSGNEADYRNWALEIAGVGGAKVFPLWNGNGTVKVLIVDSDMAVNEALEESVYDYIETVRPIGAAVTVDSPGQTVITIEANISLDGTITYDNVVAAFTASIASYFKELVFDTYTVSYAKIGSLLLGTKGIADYDTLTVNGETVNISIGDEEMPILGMITLTEVS